MRLYEFKNADGSIDVVVPTDGIGNQKRVFITETPRGISVPGDQTPTPPNPDNDILSMGFDFVAGTMREHLDFILFAANSGLQLIQWNEGLGETSPEELVPANLAFNYAITATPATLSFAKDGETKSFEVVSTKTVTSESAIKGMVINVPFTAAITGTGFTLAGNTVTAEANTGAERTGTVTLTQSQPETGAKTATVGLTQVAGA